MEDRFLPPKIKVIIKEESEDEKMFKQAFTKNPIQEYMNILSGEEILELHRLLRKLKHKAKIRRRGKKKEKRKRENKWN